MKLKILIITLITAIIASISVTITYVVETKKINDEIKNIALKWYDDNDKLYDKITIETLYTNGYLDKYKTLIENKKKKCQIIDYTKKNILTNKYDCELSETVSKIPTFYIEYIGEESNKIYSTQEWVNENIKITYKFKNENFNNKNDITFTIKDDSQNILENTFKTDDIYEKKCTFVLSIDNIDYVKYKDIKIDKIAPVLNEHKITDIYYYANYSDSNSGISKIMYYLSEENIAPKNIDDFKLYDDIKLEANKKYYVWSMAIDNAGNESSYDYLGEYTENIFTIEE